MPPSIHLGTWPPYFGRDKFKETSPKPELGSCRALGQAQLRPLGFSTRLPVYRRDIASWVSGMMGRSTNNILFSPISRMGRFVYFDVLNSNVQEFGLHETV